MRQDAAARQHRLLELLAAGRTPREAAEELGISLRAVRSHLSSPGLRRELSRLRDERLEQVAGRALAEAGPALAILRSIAEDPGAPASARVAAAGRLLEATVRLYEVTSLAARLAAVEARLEVEYAPVG